MKKILIPVLAIALCLTMSVPAFAQHIYIGDTETVVSYDENGNKVITLIFDPAKTPDYMKPDSPNYWQKPEQPQAQARTETTDSVELPEKGTAFAALPPLAEAPEVGTVLANIQQEDENGEMQFTSSYHWCAVGQCTWYANGRFREVTGIRLPLLGNAKEWINTARNCENVRVRTDLFDVPEQAIAVYVPRTDDSLPGHVCFIEYVERDRDGNPLYIYYTDANGKIDEGRNEYTPGYDGVVIKEDFETFKGSKDLELAGYITAK